MSEVVSTQEITWEVKDKLTGISPIVAVMGWLSPDKILLSRGNQKWLITITEIP